MNLSYRKVNKWPEGLWSKRQELKHFIFLSSLISWLLLSAATCSPQADISCGEIPLKAGPHPQNLIESIADASYQTFYVDPSGNDAEDGSQSKPFRSLKRALKEAGEGIRILLAEGSYYEGSLMLYRGGSADRPLIIQGKGYNKTQIKGSAKVDNWEKIGEQVWQRNNWIVNSQQVFVNGEALQQIGSLSPWNRRKLWDNKQTLPPVGEGIEDMGLHSFYYDSLEQRLLIMTDVDPNQALVEASTDDFVLDGQKIDNVHLLDLGLLHTNGTYRGIRSNVLRIGGNAWLLDQVDIAYGDFSGIKFGGTKHRIQNSLIRKNGALGLDGNNGPFRDDATYMDIVIKHCKIEANNYRKFDPFWHAGGIKVIPAIRGLKIIENIVCENYGQGIWFDHDLGENDIEGNWVINNRVGIMYEIAPPIDKEILEYGVRIRNNYVINCQQQGIYIAGSCNTLVENNTVLHAWVGIVLHGMPRKNHSLEENIVRKNLIGYSDKSDMILYTGEGSSENSIDENFYLDLSDQGRLSFSCTKEKAYTSGFSDLEEVREGSGFELKGKVGPIKWGYPEKLDLEIPENHPAYGYGVIKK
ncbi:MAG: right-handed parallel beta-helix repeat-containing protein [Bacteroidia bacterium]|nr:right-handed parallel beta-helix repeat-containing protein [Bacteroidia bacterium]